MGRAENQSFDEKFVNATNTFAEVTGELPAQHNELMLAFNGVKMAVEAGVKSGDLQALDSIKHLEQYAGLAANAAEASNLGELALRFTDQRQAFITARSLLEGSPKPQTAPTPTADKPMSGRKDG